jgi:polysaccharide pyruvyl transferase WcaK-like protein
MLIPHVDPLDGSDENSDSAYMSSLLNVLWQGGYSSEQIALLPRTYNACQLKAVISRCAYFIGARTHATIAALSTGVPTTSIAYSIKAKGINKDLFGHIRYVLETPDLSSITLDEHFSRLQNDRVPIVEMLRAKLPLWCSNSYKSAISSINKLLN